MPDELTPLQELELKALAGDHNAIREIVASLRLYRLAAAKVLRSRWGDGTIDSYFSMNFQLAVDEIESLLDEPRSFNVESKGREQGMSDE